LPELDGEQESGVTPRPFWSGAITFGLVSIPVNLFPANRQIRVSLRMLSPEGHPLSRRYYAPATGRELSDEQMVRGYEIEKDEYIVVTDEELERLAPERSRAIDLRRFVEANQIPALYFERAYFLVPSEACEKAYRLLATTMEKTKRAGIATFVMRGKEYLIAILAENGILRAGSSSWASGRTEQNQTIALPLRCSFEGFSDLFRGPSPRHLLRPDWPMEDA
jgi:DNA end-binding protein Ku